jgi:hypothetical protein
MKATTSTISTRIASSMSRNRGALGAEKVISGYPCYIP